MRKRISERNIFPNFNLYEEYAKIEYLISEAEIIGKYNQWGRKIPNAFSIEMYINDYCFIDWRLRGTSITITEMRQSLRIAKSDFDKRHITEEQVLDFCQYVFNLIMRVYSTIRKYKDLFVNTTVLDEINRNVILLTDKLGCEFHRDEQTKEIFIQYKDDLATTVATEITAINVSLSEYKRIDNRGDLRRKAEILCTLYKTLESYSDDFKGTTYNGLYSDTKLLFNKSGVRHNVEKDAIACATFLNMDDEKLEEWYDKIFDMFLSCMVITQYLNDKKDIENIKKAIGD